MNDILTAILNSVLILRRILFNISHEIDEIDSLFLLKLQIRDVVLHNDLNIQTIHFNIEQLEVKVLNFFSCEVSGRIGEFGSNAT